MKLARRVAVASTFLFVALPLLASDWPPIASQDLSMTSIPEIPGAPAVILQREETDDNMNNILIVYERIKILTDPGRAYANVELPFGRTITVAVLNGRTVHPDGSVVPFEGKALDKTVAKDDGSHRERDDAGGDVRETTSSRFHRRRGRRRGRGPSPPRSGSDGDRQRSFDADARPRPHPPNRNALVPERDHARNTIYDL